MVRISEDRFSKRVSFVGKNGGGGGCRLYGCGSCSGVMFSECDLRWVPPGFWEARVGKARQGRLSTHRGMVATGTIEVHSLITLFLQRFPSFHRHFTIKARRNYRDFGLVRFDDALWPKKYAEMFPTDIGASSAMPVLFLIGRDHRVSNPPNTYVVSYRVIWGWSVQKDNGVEVVGSFIWFCIAYYFEVLKQGVAGFICHFSETWLSYDWDRAFFRFGKSAPLVPRMAELVWIVFRPKRKGLEAHRTKFMTDESFFMESFVWIEIFFSCLLADVIMGCISKVKLFVGKVRITTSGLFSGFVHAVHYGFNICLISVNEYTAFIWAIYVPVQCVWDHCSSLGWSGVSTWYYLDGGDGLTMVMMIALLGFLYSRNVRRNHLYVWIPMEAYLAVGWVVKASMDCSYPFIRVYRAPSQLMDFLLVVVSLLSCRIAELFMLAFFVVYCCLSFIVSLRVFAVFGILLMPVLLFLF